MIAFQANYLLRPAHLKIPKRTDYASTIWATINVIAKENKVVRITFGTVFDGAQ
jgi:hypothetical protein